MANPSKFHPAYNPILFTYTDEGETYEEIDVDISSETITLRREYINGQATFDVSNIVRSYFSERLVDSINETALTIFKEPKLYVEYSVGGETYYAINAVVQIGQYQDYSNQMNKALVTLEGIKLYTGYPLDVSILCNEIPCAVTAGTLYANAMNRVKISGAGAITKINYYLADLAGDHILTKSGDHIIVGKDSFGTVTSECTPARPFYIRWINYLGGVEYYMFEFNQKRVVSLTENQVYQKYITNYLTENGTDNSYFKKAVEVITVGAGNLSVTDYNALVKMTLSPYIEVYDTTWKRVIIESASSERATKDSLNPFECTFLLPELNLQY
jgi:hypothetical protein